MTERMEATPGVDQVEPVLDGQEIVNRLFMGDEEVAATIRTAIPKGVTASSWRDVANHLSFEDEASRLSFLDFVDRFDLKKIISEEEDNNG